MRSARSPIIKFRPGLGICIYYIFTGSGEPRYVLYLLSALFKARWCFVFTLSTNCLCSCSYGSFANAIDAHPFRPCLHTNTHVQCEYGVGCSILCHKNFNTGWVYFTWICWFCFYPSLQYFTVHDCYPFWWRYGIGKKSILLRGALAVSEL